MKPRVRFCLVPALLAPALLTLGGLLWGQPERRGEVTEKLPEKLIDLSGVFNEPLGEKNRAGFDRVCAGLARGRVVRGRFVQTKTLKRLGRSLVSRGTFAVDSGLGMLWDTEEPFPSVMAVGRDFVIQSGPGGKTRLDASGNETFIRLSETLSAVFTGDSQKLTAGFTVYFAENGERWTLGLAPKDASVRAFARAIVMEGDTALRRVILHEQGGDTIVYELSGHSWPAALSAAEKAWFVP